MKGTQLGELEELVLLTVAALFDDAYGVAIMEDIETRSNRSITLSTVHTALKRLEEKDFVESRYDGATNERGGRRKHLFRITLEGEKALKKSRDLRNNLWNSIPELAFQHGK